MEDFKNRLLEFIERQGGMSVRAFEERCGITNGTIGSIKVKGPSIEVLSKISNTFPDLNLNWLVMGEGDIYKEHTTQTIGNYSNNNTQVIGENESLKRENELMKQLLDEKERTIQILMSK